MKCINCEQEFDHRKYEFNNTYFCSEYCESNARDVYRQAISENQNN